MVIPADVAAKLRRISQRLAADRAERDRLILEAHHAGASLREIETALDKTITHVGVLKIIRAKEKL